MHLNLYIVIFEIGEKKVVNWQIRIAIYNTKKMIVYRN